MTTRYLNLRAGDTAAEHVHAGSSDALTSICVRINMDFELLDEEEEVVATASQQEAVDALHAVHELMSQCLDLPGAPAAGVNAYANVALEGGGDPSLVVVDPSDDVGFVSVRMRGGTNPRQARLAVAAALAYVTGSAWPTPTTTQRNVDAHLV